MTQSGSWLLLPATITETLEIFLDFIAPLVSRESDRSASTSSSQINSLRGMIFSHSRHVSEPTEFLSFSFFHIIGPGHQKFNFNHPPFE